MVVKGTKGSRVTMGKMVTLDLLDSVVCRVEKAKKGTRLQSQRKDILETGGIQEEMVSRDLQGSSVETVCLAFLADQVFLVKESLGKKETKASRVTLVDLVQVGSGGSPVKTSWALKVSVVCLAMTASLGILGFKEHLALQAAVVRQEMEDRWMYQALAILILDPLACLDLQDPVVYQVSQVFLVRKECLAFQESMEKGDSWVIKAEVAFLDHQGLQDPVESLESLALKVQLGALGHTVCLVDTGHKVQKVPMEKSWALHQEHLVIEDCQDFKEIEAMLVTQEIQDMREWSACLV